MVSPEKVGILVQNGMCASWSGPKKTKVASHLKGGPEQALHKQAETNKSAGIQMSQLRVQQTLLKFHESVGIIFSSHVFIRP